MLRYITPSTVIEFICFFSAIICLRKDNSFVWRIMILYLFITLIAECAGLYVAKQTHNNHWVYNIFLLLEAGFSNLMFAYLFNKYINYKPIITGGLIVFILLYIYELLNHGFFRYNALTYTVMSVILVLYSLYFYYLLITDNSYINLKYSPAFWWVVGILFFYFGNTACNVFDDKLYSVMIFKKQHLSYFVFKGLNIILYSCWIYSFICRKWQTRKLETLL